MIRLKTRALHSALYCSAFFCTSLLYSSFGLAAETGKLLRFKDPKKIISEIQVLQSEVEIRPGEHLGKKVKVAAIKVRINAPGWTAWVADENMIFWIKQSQNKNNETLLRAILTGKTTRIRIRLTDNHGGKKLESAAILYPGFAESETTATDSPSAKRFSVAPSVGVAIHAYSQTGITDFSMTALFGKLDLNYWITPSTWSVGINGFGTILPITSSAPSITARFVGVNGRFGYHFGLAKGFKVGLNLGWYYTTTFVTGDAFGWNNLMGPQFFPTINYTFGRNSFGLYFKYSPIMTGVSFLSLANKEMAAGLTYSRLFDNGNSFKVGIDWSRTDLTLDADTIASNVYAFSVGYGF